MKQTLKVRVLSAVTAVATVSSIFLSASFTKAATPTDVTQTFDRLKVSEYSSSTISGTFATTWDDGDTITFDFSGGVSDYELGVADDITCSTAVGTCMASSTDADLVTATCTAGGGCSGILSLDSVTGTNSATDGSFTVTIAGTGGYSLSYAIPFVDDDQVTVTATVDPSITFDLDVGVASSSNEVPTDFAAYTVPLGTLTVTDVKVSGSADSVNSIWVDLGTNANAGAVVTVTSTNGGLKSTSVGTDNIQALGGTMATGTENYGLCAYVLGFTQDAGGPMNSASPFNSACDPNGAANSVGAFNTNTAREILNSTNLPINAGRAQIIVNAAISAATPAHNDYTDTLTFIATGTF